MDGNAEHKIEELARQKLEGKSYTEIREELRASGMKEEELGLLIRKVDDRVLKETLEQGERQRTPQYYRWGLVLAVAGLILSILYNAGLVFTGLPALAVYAPFLLGILLMFYGRMVQGKKPASTSRGPGPIRKKRPYK
jgi:hypothetical protein